MPELGDVEEYTAAFFLDSLRPSRIVLLQRAPGSFAAGQYTGIGGHRNKLRDKTIADTAAIELAQEFKELAGLPLREFARASVNSGAKALHYFWGILDPNLPLPPSSEAHRPHRLEWVELRMVKNKPAIPTAGSVLSEWERRDWTTSDTWTMYLSEQSNQQGVPGHIVVERVVPNLVEIWPD